MVAKSHIDLCMFVQVLEVSEEEIPGQMIDVVRSRSVTGVAAYLNAHPGCGFIDAVSQLHESVHSAQAVVYPFFRWYSIMTWALIAKAFKQISDAEPDLLSPAHAAGHQSFYFPTAKFHVCMDLRDDTRDDNILYFAFDRDSLPAESRHIFSANAIDLMENAASLIQYKISQSNDRPAWPDYLRWTKRNPANVEILKTLVETFGYEQILLDSFLALVQAAFHTNQPVRAFIQLFLMLEKALHRGWLANVLAAPEPRRWVEIFDSYLDSIAFDPTELGDLTYRSYFRLDPWVVSNLRLGGKVGHPILGKVTRIWGERERANIAYRYALTNPVGYDHLFTAEDMIFNPPVRIIKFNIWGGPFVVVDARLEDTGLADLQGFGAGLRPRDIRASLRDFLTVFGYVRGQAGALMDDSFRLCGHFGCPHHAANLCNGWVLIPRDYEDCDYPRHIRWLGNKWHSGATSDGERRTGTEDGSGDGRTRQFDFPQPQ